MANLVDLTAPSPPAEHAEAARTVCHSTDPADAPPKPKKRKRKSQVEDGDKAPRARKVKAKAPKEKPDQRIGCSGKAVRYCKTPSIKAKERIDRALPGSGHRMFLLSRTTVAPPGDEQGAQEKFEILGATGNVYTVTVSRTPSCTCPDAQKRCDLCKHHFYVMARVLRLAPDNQLMWQRGLLTEEVNALLSGQHSHRSPDGDVMADARLLEAHKRMCSPGGASAAPGGLAPGQRDIQGDCPICYDDLRASDAQADQVVFCKSCGNNVHRECFQRWSAARQAVGVTCVWCRAPWADAPRGGNGDGNPYVNLAAHSSHHASADTSLSALYGDSSVWIRAHSGQMGLRHAANLMRAARGRA